jgi:predicted dehydrogenase/aryl-alcohol dehydrogenase-like predicted oxidoreductase
MKSVRWGILGPGTIAKQFAAGLADVANAELVAIGTRDPSRAGLAEGFSGARIHGSYEALLADPEVDAVYIATPHPFHAQWAIRAAEAGKHVLCEKPIGLSAHEADAMFHAASKAGVFMAEAFMYRLHPQTARVLELLKEGRIGKVNLIKSGFGFASQSGPDGRLFANDLAGGGILDVGGYTASMARLVAGAVSGQAFAEPTKVVGLARLGATGVDEIASAVLHFASGLVAELSCSITQVQDNVTRIYGSAGLIEVASPWFAGHRTEGWSEIRVIDAGSTEVITIEEKRHLYSFEAAAASAAILSGEHELASPGMSWADTMGNLRVLDQWRAAVGLEFELEKPARRSLTLRGDRLGEKVGSMPRRSLPGLSKPVSTVALGIMDFTTFASGSIMLDAFFEAGGNLIDTAFVYKAGFTEQLLGNWMTTRGVREHCTVIAKGAHTPLVYPDVIGKQLSVTLDRLQTDYVDIYFMHRDNIDVPVDEFVDAMDAEVQAGRIRGPVGGSNWTRERMDAAIAYAKRTGKTAPSVLSNNFSLAEMQDPVWPDCVSSSDVGWRQWLTEREIINFAWSSQARGFFTPRAGRDRREDGELVRSWYSEGNFERRDRAIALGEQMGRNPIHIALAYVLAQPFPSVPLIGPRSLFELADSLSALDIALTPDQVRWLEVGDAQD